MRPKTHTDLPPKMLRRRRVLKSGKVWTGYYYDGFEGGKRCEIPLGTNFAEAKKKWAELEGRTVPSAGTMRKIFDRYIIEILPQRREKTRRSYMQFFKNLRAVFDDAPIDSITTQHIAQYRDYRKAKVSANREITLLSVVFNQAREWGYTNQINPVMGVKRTSERPRDFYCSDDVWFAVREQADEQIQDAMDLALLTGQRPADIRKFQWSDIRQGALELQQNKTRKKLRILLDYEGARTELGQLIDRIRARGITCLFLIATETGQQLNENTLRWKFKLARAKAAEVNPEIADKIMQFQFRDARSKAASETNLDHAQKLLGHTKAQITAKVYRRIGETVQPLK